jgi:hypothetical protein
MFLMCLSAKTHAALAYVTNSGRYFSPVLPARFAASETPGMLLQSTKGSHARATMQHTAVKLHQFFLLSRHEN